jgi:hypothetical protein
MWISLKWSRLQCLLVVINLGFEHQYQRCYIRIISKYTKPSEQYAENFRCHGKLVPVICIGMYYTVLILDAKCQ